MRAFSSVVSITGHVALGAAVLLGTTKAGRSGPIRPVARTMFFQPALPVDGVGELSIPRPVTVVPPDFGAISVSTPLPKTGATMPLFSPVYSGAVSTPGTGQPGGWTGLLTEEHAEVLTAPLPPYPDLLRQAGVQGRVVLDAVVDTTGRVLSPSISVVSATNPGFVATARQALLATLFRPARIGGKAVRMLVRIPYEFAIRNGTGRAR
jgi:TonB family protein